MSMNTTAAKERGGERKRGRPRSKAAEAAVLDAAYRLLSQHSLRTVTVEAIAAEAKVSKATIYKWWPSRAAILMSAFLRAARDSIPYPSVLTSSELQDRLHRMGEQFRGPIGKMMSVLIAESQEDPDFAQEFRQGYIQARRVEGEKLVEDGIRNDMIKDADPHTILDVIYAPLYYRLLIKHEPLTDEFITEYVDLVLRGVLTDARR
jgi:AcrR family transcriptional regulator